MDCQEARHHIWESLAEARRPDLEGHLSLCEDCRGFLETQAQLDSLLTREISAPPLSPGFRSAVMKKARRESYSVWHELLPDRAHLLGCIGATALSIPLLPFPAGSIVAAGATFTVVTYFLQTIVRGSLELWEEGRQ